MGLQQQNFENDAVASLIGWWRDAGVDVAVGETMHDWLGVGDAIKSAKPEASTPQIALVPQSLEDLVNHLMVDEIHDAGPVNRRVRPAGDPTSNLMILGDFPDPADIETGELLGDPIFTKMLQAISKDRSSVYIASLCPGRPTTGRLSEDSVIALAVLAKQHIALAAPKQLWLVGSAASRAILGVDDIRAMGKLHKVNHLGTIMDVIATAHPRMFAKHPGSKAAAWTEMQRLLPRDDV